MTLKKKCPCCKKEEYFRVKRLWWMRILPLCKHYICKECLSHFVCFFNHVIVGGKKR